MREAIVLAKSSGNFVVQYYDSWIESNIYIYIQMELCSDNLKNIIKQKAECFQRQSTEAMNSIAICIYNI